VPIELLRQILVHKGLEGSGAHGEARHGYGAVDLEHVLIVEERAAE